jgi:hypothetical protein
MGLGCFTATNTDPGQSGSPSVTCSTCKRDPAGGAAGGSSGGSTAAGNPGSSGGSTAGNPGSSGGTAAGTSGGAAATGAGGNNGGSTGCSLSNDSGGNGGAFSCPYAAVPAYDGGCPSGAAMRSTLVDISACTPLSATIAAIDSTGVPVSGDSTSSDPCSGAFSLCTPTGGPFSLQIQTSGYPNTYTAEMTSISSGSFPQIEMVPTDELDALEGLVTGVTIDPTKNVLIAGVTSQSGSCYGPTEVGWKFTLTFPDGGPFPDGGFYQTYEDATFLPDPSLTATSTLGTSVFFNVDPTLSNYVLITATNPNPGYCDPRNATLGFTGRVVVVGGALSYDAFLQP